MNKFHKIPYEQYLKDFHSHYDPNFEDYYKNEYDSIKLPNRATKNSAGYDIYATVDLDLYPGESIKFPTGISVELDDDKFLLVVPRSGLGCKYRLQLDNTVGVIDSDYYGSDNHGHIWAKVSNDSNEEKILHLKRGEAFTQGIILQYFKTDDDNTETVRNGGFGSTDVHST